MIKKKKLAEVKKDVAALLGELPGKSPRSWLEKEIASAKTDPSRDVETLEMLCAALEAEAGKARATKARRKTTKR